MAGGGRDVHDGEYRTYTMYMSCIPCEGKCICVSCLCGVRWKQGRWSVYRLNVLVSYLCFGLVTLYIFYMISMFLNFKPTLSVHILLYLGHRHLKHLLQLS